MQMVAPAGSIVAFDARCFHAGGANRTLSGVMPVDEVCAWIEFALDRPPGTIPKRLVFFPTNEWH